MTFTTRPELTGDLGMIASTHWLATAAGMAILEQGGNAFDAAATAGFVMQVVEPHLSGPAGEVPMIVHDARSAVTEVIAGQGPAPAGATIGHYRSLGMDLVPGTGLLAACVPAAFDAWLTLIERHGTMTPAQVLAPSISYAERGWEVHPQLHRTLTAVERTFREHWPTSAAAWLPGGAPPAAGSRLRNPVLAATYRRIAALDAGTREQRVEAARDAFYTGFVADAIDAFCRVPVRDSTGERHPGVLTGDDLAAWRTPVEEPVALDYRDYRVVKTGPWGQGPVLLQQLALLAGFDLDDTAVDDPQFVHTVVECAKLAFADREAFYGDPDVVDVPLEALLSQSYADERRRLVGDTAAAELRPGHPDGREPRLPANLPTVSRTSAHPGVGEPTVARSGATRGDTCHVDVVDRWGNLVSATPSGGWLQSSPVIPSLGFPLGTRAQMFWLEEGLASSLAPGARPRTTLSPSLAFRDGAPYLAWGTPGGDQQDQWSLLMLLRLVHQSLGLQEAIDAPAWHSTHLPSSFYPRERAPLEIVAESRLGAATFADLRRRGHEVTDAGPWTLGRLSAVARDRGFPGDGFLRAAANPRGMQGYAAGR